MTALTDDQVLFDLGEVVETPAAERRDVPLSEQFARFHADNPKVLLALEVLLHRWFDAGHEHGSVKHAYTLLRWEHGMKTGETPRLNNNWPAFYARLLIERNPSWEGRIATRVQKAAS